MANAAKILAPRRGSKTTMSTSPGNAIVLAKGEIFIEDDTTNGIFRIKVGDGVTAYASLDYAFSGNSADIAFDNTESGLTSTNVEDAIKEVAESIGSGSGVCYGTCSTEASTAAKVVTVSQDQDFELKVGATVAVKFTNTNTASSCTLNVNNTTAKSIYYANAVYTGNDSYVCGEANVYILYMYDGTNWVWIGISKVMAKDWYGTESQYSAIVTPDPSITYFVVPDPPVNE